MLICWFCYEHSGVLLSAVNTDQKESSGEGLGADIQPQGFPHLAEAALPGRLSTGRHKPHWGEQRSRLRDQGLSPPHYSAMVIVLLTLWHPWSQQAPSSKLVAELCRVVLLLPPANPRKVPAQAPPSTCLSPVPKWCNNAKCMPNVSL